MFNVHLRVCRYPLLCVFMTSLVKIIIKFLFPGSKAYHIMKDLKQTTTLPSLALESFLLKSTIATMASPGQVGEMFSSSSLNPPISRLTHVSLRLAVAPFELACISFAILILGITIVLKEMSSL